LYIPHNAQVYICTHADTSRQYPVIRATRVQRLRFSVIDEVRRVFVAFRLISKVREPRSGYESTIILPTTIGNVIQLLLARAQCIVLKKYIYIITCPNFLLYFLFLTLSNFVLLLNLYFINDILH